MKIRVKCAGQRLALGLPRGSTLGDLQRLVAIQTALPGDPSEVVLSLNNRDALTGGPDTPLSELGVCSGDLLWLLSPAVPPPAPAADAPALGAKRALGVANGDAATPLPTTPAAAQESVGHEEGVYDTAEQMQVDASAGQVEPGEAGSPDDQHGGQAGHAPEQRLPGYLLRTLLHSRSQRCSPADVLLLAAHAAMLETGFRPSWAAGQQGVDGGAYAVPAACWVSASLCRIQYQLAIGSEEGMQQATCTLHCSSMGPGAVLAVAARRHSRHLSLQAAAFVATAPSAADPAAAGCSSVAAGSHVQLLPDGGLTVGGRLRMSAAASRRLWTALKDALAFPMLLAVHAEVGVAPPAGLLALPEELKHSVLSALGPHDLAALACACCELRHLASHDDLWRPLFQREFPHAPAHFATQAQHRGYKWAFGVCWRERQERQEALRRARSRAFAPAVPRFEAPPPFYPLPQRPGHPYMIGGDYDRLPQIGPTGVLGGAPPGGPFLGGSRRQGTRGLGGFRMH